MNKMMKSITTKVKSPDGTIFVNVIEEDNEPNSVIINIGKSGAPVAAWAQALGAVISTALQNGTKLESILSDLSSITSDGKTRLGEKLAVRSGPEGVYVALLYYRRAKFEDIKRELAGAEEEQEYYAGSLDSR